MLKVYLDDVRALDELRAAARHVDPLTGVDKDGLSLDMLVTVGSRGRQGALDELRAAAGGVDPLTGLNEDGLSLDMLASALSLGNKGACLSMRQSGLKLLSPALPDRMGESHHEKELQLRLTIGRLASMQWGNNQGPQLPVDVRVAIFTLVLDSLGYRGSPLHIVVGRGTHAQCITHHAKGSRVAPLPDSSVLERVPHPDGELPRRFLKHGSDLPDLDPACLDMHLGAGKTPADASRARLNKLCSISSGAAFVARWHRGRVQIYAPANHIAWYADATLAALDPLFAAHSARNLAWCPLFRGKQPQGLDPLESAVIGRVLANERCALPGKMSQGQALFMGAKNKEHGVEISEGAALSVGGAKALPADANPADVIVADGVLKQTLNGMGNAAEANSLHNAVLVPMVWALNSGMNTAEIAAAWDAESTFATSKYGVPMRLRDWIAAIQCMAHYLRVKKKRFARNIRTAANALPAERPAALVLRHVAGVLDDHAAAHW